jgi:hypothetical protein
MANRSADMHEVAGNATAAVATADHQSATSWSLRVRPSSSGLASRVQVPRRPGC